MPGKHALYAPSASGRWMVCGGSVEAEKGLDRTSSYAEHGSFLHGVAYQCLINGTDAKAGGDLSADDADTVQAYVDYVRRKRGTKFYEVRSEFVPGLCGGVADAVIISPDGKTVEVTDFKAGTGVPVSPKENTQLIIYALGAIKKYRALYNFEKVKLTIVQPTLGKPKTWSISLIRLEAWGEKIEKRIAAIEAKDPEAITLVPSESNSVCRFCDARHDCPALQKVALSQAKTDFAGVDMTIGQKFSLVAMCRAWCKGVETEATRLLLGGDEDVDGWKVVEGRRTRSWNGDEGRKGAKKLLEGYGCDETEIFTEPKMVSPAQAEKLEHVKGKGSGARKAALAEHVHVADGPPVVAPEDDPRPAMNKQDLAKRDFENLPPEDK